MSIVSLSLFIINLFIIFSILIQEDNRKNTKFSFNEKTFFNSLLEKITFFSIFAQFFLLLIQNKFNLF